MNIDQVDVLLAIGNFLVAKVCIKYIVYTFLQKYIFVNGNKLILIYVGFDKIILHRRVIFHGLCKVIAMCVLSCGP